MLVICDNPALSAMAEIEMIDLLPRIVGPMTIPGAIAREASHPAAPAALRELARQPPAWLTVHPDPAHLLDETASLGAGESDAISLAWQNRETCSLIMDEKRGRAVANSLSLPVTGLLAILVSAARSGLVDFEDALARLQATGIRLSSVLIEGARLKATRP
jgi:predicted nucleic acid-binding protein